MEKCSAKITSKRQFERMIELLAENPDAARGKGQFGNTKQQMKNFWETITVSLNSIGPPTRTAPEWQRVWTHYKCKLKTKLASNKRNATATGGGPLQEIYLSPLERSVVNLVNLQQSVSPIGRVFGLASIEASTQQENEPAESEEELPSVSVTPRRIRSKKGDQRVKLLEKQTESQFVHILTKIEKNTYKRYEVAKKLYELKKQKLEALKKSAQEDSQLKRLKIELVKK